MSAPPGSDGRFEAFCLVGLGHHARTKLLPALAANGQLVAGLVTRGDPQGLPDAPIFPDIETALGELPSRTVFVIATPPALHFAQTLPIIRAGRDVIVEKPAFASRNETMEVAEEAARSGSVLAEAFMHRHTRLYSELVDAFRSEAPITGLSAEFLVPEMPTSGTFRGAADIACSSLYDMGCYPLSLLSDLGLPIDELAITHVDHPGDPGREALRLAGQAAGIDVEISIGVGAAYTNKVSIRSASGRSVSFEPFFFGRPGERRIVSTTAWSVSERKVREAVAFEEMFAVTRSVWLAGQGARLRRMIQVATALERLGGALATFRKNGAL